MRAHSSRNTNITAASYQTWPWRTVCNALAKNATSTDSETSVSMPRGGRAVRAPCRRGTPAGIEHHRRRHQQRQPAEEIAGRAGHLARGVQVQRPANIIARIAPSPAMPMRRSQRFAFALAPAFARRRRRRGRGGSRARPCARARATTRSSPDPRRCARARSWRSRRHRARPVPPQRAVDQPRAGGAMHAVGEQHDLAPARARRRVAGEHVLAVPGGGSTSVASTRLPAASRGSSRRASRRGSSGKPRRNRRNRRRPGFAVERFTTAASASTGSPQWKHATHAAAGPAPRTTASITRFRAPPGARTPPVARAASARRCAMRRPAGMQTHVPVVAEVDRAFGMPEHRRPQFRARVLRRFQRMRQQLQWLRWSKSPPVGNASMPPLDTRTTAPSPSERARSLGPRVRDLACPVRRTLSGTRSLLPEVRSDATSSAHTDANTASGGDRDQQPHHGLRHGEDFASVASITSVRRSRFRRRARAAIGGADPKRDRLAAVRRGIAGHRHQH